MIRNLIWDLDGTIVDTYPAFVTGFAAALADYGQTRSPEYIERLARIEIDTCSDKLAAEVGAQPDEFEQRFLEHYYAVPPEQQPVFPGVRELCEHIVALGGANVIVTNRRRHTGIHLLQAHRLDHLIIDLAASGDPYPPKPDPSSFLAMIALHGFKPEETLTIGDREKDIQAGKAAGIKTCLFGSEKIQTTPDFAITDYAQIYSYL